MKHQVSQIMTIVLINFFTVSYNLAQTVFESTPFVNITETVHNINWKKSLGKAKIISNFKEGAAIYKLNNKLGIINTQGHKLSAAIYDDIHMFQQGYAAVKKGEKWSFINQQGQHIIDFIYDWAVDFKGNLAAVRKNGKWGVINAQGYELVPTIYEAVKIEKNNVIWTKSNNKWQLFTLEKLSDNLLASL
jgi:hypothetical protein